MKIHIVCGPFFPELHPRSFRCTELAKEFARLGHDVSVTSFMGIENFDYAAFAKENGIRQITQLGLYWSKSISDGTAATKTKYPKLFALRYRITEYLIGGSTLFRARYIANRLNIDNDVDMIIAVSTPFMSQLGTSYYLKQHKFKSTCVFIADSGDPYYYSPQAQLGPWFKCIERNVYMCFDFLTIPTETALSCYTKLIPQSKIRIIPQGFNMRNLNLYKGEFAKPVKFAYSGVFYWNIRNPEFLFAFLNNVDIDFEFHLFLRYPDTVFTNLLEKYSRLKSKTNVIISLTRDKLLYELSRMDFLINVDNLSNKQIPSKLIDYGIVGRPIFNCNLENFDKHKLLDYLIGNYHDSLQIDVDRFNIENIVKDFLTLYKEKNTTIK